MKHEPGKTAQRRVWSSLALLNVALFTGCGADAATSGTSSDDANLAYEALSAKIQACQDENDTCVTAAAGDATKEAACATAEKTCVDKTKGEQKQAHDSLARAAGGCFRDGDDDDAGPQGPCGQRRHGCLMQHGPSNASQCLEDLFSCLEKKAAPGATQAAGLNECVDAAHSCVMSNMSQRGSRAGDKPGAGGPGSNGPGKPGAGGPGSNGPGKPGAGPGVPGGHAGGPAAGGPAHVGGAAGGFSAGPGAPGGHAGEPAHAGGYSAGPGSHAGGAGAHTTGGAGGGWH